MTAQNPITIHVISTAADGSFIFEASHTVRGCTYDFEAHFNNEGILIGTACFYPLTKETKLACMGAGLAFWLQHTQRGQAYLENLNTNITATA